MDEQRRTTHKTRKMSAIEQAECSSQFNQVPPELLEDWLVNMSMANETSAADYSTFMEYWSDSGVVEFLFLCCQKMNIPREVKYLAMELFDRFLVKHVQDLQTKVNRMSPSKSITWKQVEQRVQNQLVLRIVSTIQVASKLHSHYQNLNPSDVRIFLQGAGYTFSLESITTSELRIIETLDYHINVPTPLMHIEVLLHILVYNDPTVNLKVLRQIAVKILDSVYLTREDIYQKLFLQITGQVEQPDSPEYRVGLCRVKSDYLLLATVIIAVSAHIHDPQTYKKISEQMHDITRIKLKEIYNFSKVMLDVILDYP